MVAQGVGHNNVPTPRVAMELFNVSWKNDDKSESPYGAEMNMDC